MKKLLILSGKGGTGKTTAAAAFVRFANAHAFADCDVDAPNLHLVTGMASAPEVSDYYGSNIAAIDSDFCINCGICAKSCRFDAIQKNKTSYEVNEYICEGCGVCAYVCPRNAITFRKEISGQLQLYRDDRIFSTATLKMGRGNSGKLVTAVKDALDNTTDEKHLQIIDGSPGIGCPVIASIGGVSLVLIIAEPSVSGISDMKRILDVASLLRAKTAVCVNKYDIGLKITETIETYCKDRKIPFMGKIPYDKQASLAVNAGKSIAEIDCSASHALKTVFDNTLRLLGVSA